MPAQGMLRSLGALRKMDDVHALLGALRSFRGHSSGLVNVDQSADSFSSTVLKSDCQNLVFSIGLLTASCG